MSRVAKKKSRKDNAKARDMRRVRDSVRGLNSSQPFIGRRDPRKLQTAVDGLGALAELTGQTPADVLLNVARLPKKRGRKQDPRTPARILLAAKCKAEGMTQYKMARQLFPELSQNAAYSLTRPFLSQNKLAIESAVARIQSKTS
jgi:hypothetical protein